MERERKKGRKKGRKKERKKEREREREREFQNSLFKSRTDTLSRGEQTGAQPFHVTQMLRHVNKQQQTGALDKLSR